MTTKLARAKRNLFVVVGLKPIENMCYRLLIKLEKKDICSSIPVYEPSENDQISVSSMYQI